MSHAKQGGGIAALLRLANDPRRERGGYMTRPELCRFPTTNRLSAYLTRRTGLYGVLDLTLGKESRVVLERNPDFFHVPENIHEYHLRRCFYRPPSTGRVEATGSDVGDLFEGYITGSATCEIAVSVSVQGRQSHFISRFGATDASEHTATVTASSTELTNSTSSWRDNSVLVPVDDGVEPANSNHVWSVLSVVDVIALERFDDLVSVGVSTRHSPNDGRWRVPRVIRVGTLYATELDVRLVRFPIGSVTHAPNEMIENGPGIGGDVANYESDFLFLFGH